MKDQKEALTSGRKPDLTHVRLPFKVYAARGHEYGCDKYERANYLRRTPGLPEDVARLRTYLRALVSHVDHVLEALEHHQANDPRFDDVEGTRRAAYCADTDADTTGRVGPSFLPHLCGAAASLNMAIAQAVDCGLLPADPGQPWREVAKARERISEDAPHVPDPFAYRWL